MEKNYYSYHDVILYGVIDGGGVAFAKTKKVTMNLVGAKTIYKSPVALDKAKKVTIKNSKKSVVKVKYKKTKKVRRIIFTARKLGMNIEKKKA